MGIFDIFTTKNADEAARLQTQGLTRGYEMAADLFGQGRDALKTNFTAGLKPFVDNFAAFQPGLTAYGDATGANGPAGYAAAIKNFQFSPGYKFRLDQGNENVLRNASRTGTLHSGGTNIDLLNYGQGMAAQDWQQWVQNLLPFVSGAQNTAAGIGQMYGNLGTQLNQTYGTQANAAYGTQAGIGNANANAALAKNNASANIWGALGSGLNLASGLMGFGGLSALTGGLFNGSGGGTEGFTFSDARVKDDIEPIGETFDGQTLYRYSYIDDPATTHIGLIAQEVEARDPGAVAEFSGIKAVDYGRATDFAAKLGEFLNAA